jgi:S1-C subfamily serine protease
VNVTVWLSYFLQCSNTRDRDLLQYFATSRPLFYGSRQSHESEGFWQMERTMQAFWVAPLVAFVLTVIGGAQVLQEKPPVDPLQALNASLGQLTTKVAPAVVHIRVTSYRSSAGEHEDDDSKAQTLVKQHGSGSGVIVDPEGYIVTALHLVEGERRIRVELDSRVFPKASTGQTEDHGYRSSFEAKLVGSFKDADLAVLKMDFETPFLWES